MWDQREIKFDDYRNSCILISSTVGEILSCILLFFRGKAAVTTISKLGLVYLKQKVEINIRNFKNHYFLKLANGRFATILLELTALDKMKHSERIFKNFKIPSVHKIYYYRILHLKPVQTFVISVIATLFTKTFLICISRFRRRDLITPPYWFKAQALNSRNK